MVINKFGDQLYSGLEDTIVKHLQLIEKKVEAAQGESFLSELKLRWDHHNKSMQMIRDILMVCSLPSSQHTLTLRILGCSAVHYICCVQTCTMLLYIATNMYCTHLALLDLKILNLAVHGPDIC